MTIQQININRQQLSQMIQNDSNTDSENNVHNRMSLTRIMAEAHDRNCVLARRYATTTHETAKSSTDQRVFGLF